jgi:exodeoxyribonuclease VII small subunit
LNQENEQELTLEELLQNVETITKQLEDSEISLEDSFALYEQGMKQLKRCKDKIDEVEKKMLVVNSNGELEQF